MAKIGELRQEYCTFLRSEQFYNNYTNSFINFNPGFQNPVCLTNPPTGGGTNCSYELIICPKDLPSSSPGWAGRCEPIITNFQRNVAILRHTIPTTAAVFQLDPSGDGKLIEILNECNRVSALRTSTNNYLIYPDMTKYGGDRRSCGLKSFVNALTIQGRYKKNIDDFCNYPFSVQRLNAVQAPFAALPTTTTTVSTVFRWGGEEGGMS